MNQILTTKPVKPKKTVDMRIIKMFFAISIIIFGVCLVTSGSYAVYKSSVAKANNRAIESQNIAPTEPENSGIEIHLSVVGTTIQVTVTGENEISFVTYKWDDEEETREDISGVSGEIAIDIPEGKHTLTVTAVDINNNTETKEQQVTGAVAGNGRPKLEVVQDGNEFLIIASDETGLDKLEFILNGQGYLVRVEGEKEKEFRYPLEEGDNTLEVTAYNLDGITETFNAICHN